MLRDHLIQAGEGALGAMAGTYLLRQAGRLQSKLPEHLRGPDLLEDPGEYMVSRAEKLRGELFPPRQYRAASKGLGWAYGIFWGAVLGAVAPKLRLHSLARMASAGAALGAAVWAVGYLGWLPATGLARPIHRERPTRTLSALVMHVAYGMVAALPIFLIERRRQRRLSRWRRLLAACA